MSFNIRVKINSTDVEVKSGTNARGPWQIREQEGFLFKSGDEYPEKIVLVLDDNAQPYQPGMYELDEKSIYVGKFKQPQLRMRLKAVAAATQKAVGAN